MHTCICVCMHVHVHVLCVDKRPMPCVFLCCSPPQFLKQSLSDPGANRAVPVFYMGVRDPISGPYLYSSEPFPYWAISTAPRRTSRRLQERKGMDTWLIVLSFMPMSVCAPNHAHTLKGSCWSLTVSTLQSDVFACG